MTEDEAKLSRALKAFDWVAHVYLPAFLRMAKMEDQAKAFEALPKIERREQSALVFTRSRQILEEVRERRFPGFRTSIWDAVSDAIGSAELPIGATGALDVLGIASDLSTIASDAAKIAVATGHATTAQVHSRESELEQELARLLAGSPSAPTNAAQPG